tara:strand:- start:1318 stop:1512 length:195 start_codon:yes stop_codon:yes gene_type:complete
MDKVTEIKRLRRISEVSKIIMLEAEKKMPKATMLILSLNFENMDFTECSCKESPCLGTDRTSYS